MAERIHVEVVWAQPGRVLRRSLMLDGGATIGDAVAASGLCNEPGVGAVEDDCVGVFGRRLPPDHLLRDGDRVEIYRPLQLEPMEARRRRAISPKAR